MQGAIQLKVHILAVGSERGVTNAEQIFLNEINVHFALWNSPAITQFAHTQLSPWRKTQSLSQETTSL